MAIRITTTKEHTVLVPESYALSIVKPCRAPLLTIVIPCYRQEEFLPRAIGSVKSLGIPAEIVVVFDGEVLVSNEELASLLINSEMGLTTICLEENWGLATARNIGVENARGEYFLPLDADNSVFAENLLAAVSEIERLGADAGFGALLRHGEGAGLMGAVAWPPKTSTPYNFIDAMAVYRKSLWVSVGGFNVLGVSGHEDYEFWLKVHESGARVIKLPHVLGKYDVRPDSMIHSTAWEEKVEAMNEIWFDHPELFGG